jgi:hypothetical protein
VPAFLLVGHLGVIAQQCNLPPIAEKTGGAMKGIAAVIGLSGLSGGGSLLAGAPWLVVLAAIVLPPGMAYWVVLRLADPSRSRSVSSSLLSWEAPSDREDSRPMRKGR